MLLGPVASDYNGPQPAPPVVPITDVTITDCDFGAPTNAAEPWFMYNVKGVTLKNITIAGKVYNQTLNAPA